MEEKSQFMIEQQREWAEPVIDIKSKEFTPNVCCTAIAYDNANRRWYKLILKPPEVSDLYPEWRDDWEPLDREPKDSKLKYLLEGKILCFKPDERENTLTTNLFGYPLKWSHTEESLICPPINDIFYFPGALENTEEHTGLARISFSQLEEKEYVSRGMDVFDWDGNGNVNLFRRIESDADVEAVRNEVLARMALNDCIQKDPRGQHYRPYDQQDYDSYTEETARRFNVAPIEAVVLHDETSLFMLYRDPANEPSPDTWEVAGYVTYHGQVLDELPTALVGYKRGPSGYNIEDVEVDETQVRDLIRGVWELSETGVVHGNINHSNLILADDSSSQVSRLLLMGLGGKAPGYKNDADGLADTLFWLLRHSNYLVRDEGTLRRVVVAAALLKEGDFRRATRVLLKTTPRTKYKRTREYYAERLMFQRQDWGKWSKSPFIDLYW
jgi:hypothetical protein